MIISTRCYFIFNALLIEIVTRYLKIEMRTYFQANRVIIKKTTRQYKYQRATIYCNALSFFFNNALQ